MLDVVGEGNSYRPSPWRMQGAVSFCRFLMATPSLRRRPHSGTFGPGIEVLMNESLRIGHFASPFSMRGVGLNEFSERGWLNLCWRENYGKELVYTPPLTGKATGHSEEEVLYQREFTKP